MKKHQKVILCLSLLLNVFNIFNIFNPIQLKATNTLQSQGKLVYSDGTGNEVIIDTNDHELLQQDIAEINSNLETLNCITCGRATLKYDTGYVLSAYIPFDTPMITDNISVVAIPIMESGKVYDQPIQLVSVDRNGCTIRAGKSAGDFKVTDECDIYWIAMCK